MLREGNFLKVTQPAKGGIQAWIEPSDDTLMGKGIWAPGRLPCILPPLTLTHGGIS